MAIQKIQNQWNSGSGTSIAVGMTSTQDGNLLVAIVAWEGGGSSSVSVADNTGGGWTQVGTTGVVSASKVALFYKINAPGVTSITATLGDSGAVGVVHGSEWSGAGAPDQNTGGGGTTPAGTTTFTATASLTPSGNGQLLIAAISCNADAEFGGWWFGPGVSSWTNMGPSAQGAAFNHSQGFEYQIQTTATARQAQFGGSSSANFYVGVIATFPPAQQEVVQVGMTFKLKN